MAFDSSESLVQLARQRTGLDIKCNNFDKFQTDPQSIHGIWACASLLHLSPAQLPKTFNHLSRFLVLGGVFYCSFKYGDGEIERGGRRFTNLNEDRLKMILSETDLSIELTWQSSDLRPNHEGERWLNSILIR